MQFPYQDNIMNLLDTPGHADFSEDTYRTLTAVDAVLMVIDVAKGVEKRTIKLMGVCRLRNTPIMTFINKLDRIGKDPIHLLDEIESVLKIQCTPITWPIGMGQDFKGIYHLVRDQIYLYTRGHNDTTQTAHIIQNLDNSELDQRLGDMAMALRLDIELLRGASNTFDKKYVFSRKTNTRLFRLCS